MCVSQFHARVSAGGYIFLLFLCVLVCMRLFCGNGSNLSMVQ